MKLACYLWAVDRHVELIPRKHILALTHKLIGEYKFKHFAN